MPTAIPGRWGRIANLGGTHVSVVEDMFDPGRFTNVRRSDIESMEPSKVSMMPEGLLNSLKEEEILDLMAFLLARGDRPAAVPSEPVSVPAPVDHRLPPPGTILTRPYKGQPLHVQVRTEGFAFPLGATTAQRCNDRRSRDASPCAGLT